MREHAVAMWPTPWYLKIVGVPAWRVKTNYGVYFPFSPHSVGVKWRWEYYRDIHDYAKRNKS